MDDNIVVKELNGNYIVQKSRALLSASDIDYTANQLKMIDTYLSCINSRDPENDTIVFPLKEYEKLMGVKRMRTHEVAAWLKTLSTLAITVYGNDDYEMNIFPLFSQLSTKIDSSSGERLVYLKCNSMAKPYFFNIEDKGYVSYRLSNVTSMKSKHSIHLYQYLKANVYRHKWRISLGNLKEMVLHIEPDSYQDNFKDFRVNILDKAVEEINRETDIKVKYKAITPAGKVSKIEFVVNEK